MRLCDPRRLCALIVCLSSLAFVPVTPVLARPVASAPDITAFEMEPVERFAPGAELFFRVQGTPGSRATVRVSGVTRTIVLQEVDDGVYEGSYTLRASDRAAPNSSATVTLRRNNRSSTTRMAGLSSAAPPVAAAPQAQQPQQRAPAPAPTLTRFVVTPIERIEPGAELKFALDGTPGARASFTIENVAGNVPMSETTPGHYEGSYTVRRLDKISEGMPIVATLEANGQAVRSGLSGRRSMLVDAQPPSIRNLQPKDGETVVATGPVSVSATFDDRGGVGVDPASIKVHVGGRDVTGNATVNKNFFTYRSELAPGRYVADVSAKDLAGNAVRSAWSFVVEQQATGAVGMPLEVTNYTPNAVVNQGRLQIRGRTAPGATIDAEVTGHANVAGLIGVTQKLYSEHLVADANGRFGFEFQPQLQVPGMRYEVNLKASSRDGQQKDTKLVLFQQQ